MTRFQFFLPVFALMGVFTSVQAQQHSLGPTVGVNLSSISDIDDSAFKPGLNVGVVYNFSNNENFGFGTEIRYSQEGVKVNYENVDVDGFVNINYLRVPLKFQYFVGALGNDFRPKLYVGPSMGFLIDGKTKVAADGLTIESDINRDDYNTFDVGVMGGFGFNYRIATATWINFDAAYTHGLLEVGKETDQFNRNFNINLGIAWGF